MAQAPDQPFDPKPLLGPICKVEAADLARPAELAARLTAALREAHCVPVSGPLPSEAVRAQWDRVVAAIGTPLSDGEDGASGVKDGSIWLDVRYDPQRQYTFRHSCTAQPLHTDGAYNLVPADVIIFLCEENVARGGDTTLIDALSFACTAQRKDPGLYRDLFTIPVPYGKAGLRGRSATVLEQREEGLYVNWNYYRVLKDGDEPVRGLAERLHAFLQHELAELVTPIKLMPGDGLLLADRRVLHGRPAFPAGPRCLWKCALLLDEA